VNYLVILKIDFSERIIEKWNRSLNSRFLNSLFYKMTERNFLAKYFTKYRKNIHHLLSLKVKEDEIREKEDQIKNLMEENLNLKFELSNLVKII